MLWPYHIDILDSANITDIYLPLKIFMAGELCVGEYVLLSRGREWLYVMILN